MLEYDVIEENNFRELHGDVVFVGSGLEVADHGGADAEGRDGDPGQDHGARLGGLGVHQEQCHVFFHDPVKKTQDLQRVEDVDQSGRIDHTDQKKTLIGENVRLFVIGNVYLLSFCLGQAFSLSLVLHQKMDLLDS